MIWRGEPDEAVKECAVYSLLLLRANHHSPVLSLAKLWTRCRALMARKCVTYQGELLPFRK